MILFSLGTTVYSKIIHKRDKAALRSKRLDKPHFALIRGEMTIEAAKLSPIKEPITAMALPRFSSVIKSLIIAVATAPIAPAPWSILPKSMV